MHRAIFKLDFYALDQQVGYGDCTIFLGLMYAHLNNKKIEIASKVKVHYNERYEVGSIRYIEPKYVPFFTYNLKI